MIMLAFVVWIIGFTPTDAQTCALCGLGKYKSTSGNVPCTDCPQNTFLNITGGVVENDCFKCPSNSMSGPGQTNITGCKCLPGFYMTIAYTCETCPVGTFKGELGNDKCTSCVAAGTTTESPGMTSANNCTCDKGFGLSAGVCQQCSPGFFKSAIANVGCSTCGPNSTSPPQSTGSSNCSCMAGFSGPNGGTCTACEAGKFKSVSGAQACGDCPSNSSSPSASEAQTACTCNVGFSGPAGGPCAACGMGKYKNATSSACVDCPQNTYSNITGATSLAACVPCRSSSTSLVGTVSAHQCYCNQGYVTDALNNTCTACLPGKFMQFGSAACSNCEFGKYAASSGNTNSEACLQCGAGKFSMTNQSQCDSCPDGTSSLAGSGVVTNCSCNAGFQSIVPGQLGGTCVQCEAGKYKETRGTAVCTSFLPGTYGSALGATSQSNASACPGNSNSQAGITLVTQCSCNLGYTGAITTTASTCTACTAGKFKNTTGSGACVDCEANYYSDVVARTNSSCQKCGDNAISNAGSASFGSCQCKAGFGPVA